MELAEKQKRREAQKVLATPSKKGNRISPTRRQLVIRPVKTGGRRAKRGRRASR